MSPIGDNIKLTLMGDSSTIIIYKGFDRKKTSHFISENGSKPSYSICRADSEMMKSIYDAYSNYLLGRQVSQGKDNQLL